MQYHLRRVFAALAGVPFSEYVRRRRITLAAADTDRPAVILAGHAARVPLVHHGVNPHVQERIASIPPEEHARLKELNDTEPAGILAVTSGLEPDAPEGLDTLDVSAGTWAVFHSSGRFPEALQRMWAATAAEWFPSNPWRMREGRRSCAASNSPRRTPPVSSGCPLSRPGPAEAVRGGAA